MRAQLWKGVPEYRRSGIPVRMCGREHEKPLALLEINHAKLIAGIIRPNATGHTWLRSEMALFFFERKPLGKPGFQSVIESIFQDGIVKIHLLTVAANRMHHRSF